MSRLRYSTAAQSGVRPQKSSALTSAPCAEQQPRDGELVVEDRHQQRPDAVGVGELDVGAGRDAGGAPRPARPSRAA